MHTTRSDAVCTGAGAWREGDVLLVGVRRAACAGGGGQPPHVQVQLVAPGENTVRVLCVGDWVGR